MRVAIVYNQPKPSSPSQHWLSRSRSEGTVMEETFQDASEYDVLQEAQLIEGFLRETGYEVVLHGVDDPGSLWTFLERQQLALIFNCCESLRGNARLEMNVANIFEILDIPFTGRDRTVESVDCSTAASSHFQHGISPACQRELSK